MIVKNKPLLKIERVFVQIFEKIYKTVKKKKRSDERYNVSGQHTR